MSPTSTDNMFGPDEPHAAFEEETNETSESRGFELDGSGMESIMAEPPIVTTSG